MRSSPIYNSGALAFNVGNETPRVGEVVTSLWNFAVNKLRFKILTPSGDKASSVSTDQDEASPVIGSSKSERYIITLHLYPVNILHVNIIILICFN